MNTEELKVIETEDAYSDYSNNTTLHTFSYDIVVQLLQKFYITYIVLYYCCAIVSIILN